jgi:hypothetical protein
MDIAWAKRSRNGAGLVLRGKGPSHRINLARPVTRPVHSAPMKRQGLAVLFKSSTVHLAPSDKMGTEKTPLSCGPKLVKE